VLIALLRRYCLKLVFALTLLLGLQIPNFLQQYEIRLDGHYIEAKNHLLEYQRVADRHFAGDLQALVTKHLNSDEKFVQDEAFVIKNLFNRFNELQAQKDRLNAPLLERLLFLAGQLKSPLFRETQNSYNAEIVLNKNAISVGLVFALICSLLLELLFFISALLANKVFFCRSKITPRQ
jgi:hypothetical protein